MKMSSITARHLVAIACAWAATAAASAALAIETEGSYWSGQKDGWFWYQDPPPPKKAPAPQPPAPPAGQSAPKKHPDLAAFEALQRRVEERQRIAIANPTEENVRAFLAIWQLAQQKASTFTDVAQAVMWKTPSVDANFQDVRPANPVAMGVFDRGRAAAQEASVRALARTHGLFFFFRGDCPYCHAFAPLLRQFAQQAGFTVFPISLDGGVLPDYPNAQRDNGMAARLMSELGIAPQDFQVPFTALAQPTTREVIPIGFGVMNAAEMTERIALVLQLRAQQVTATQQPR